MGVKAIKIDLFSKKALKSIESYEIDIVLNCVALTNIEACEKRPNEAFKLTVSSRIIAVSAIYQYKINTYIYRSFFDVKIFCIQRKMM